MNFLKGIFAQKSPLERTIVLLICLLFGVSLGSACATAFSLFINDENTLLKTTQGALAIGAFLVPTLLCAYLFSTQPQRYLQILPTRQPRFYLLAVGIILCSIPAINLLAEWNNAIALPKQFSAVEQWMRAQEANAAQLTQQLLATDSVLGYLGNLLVMAFLPAVCEELFFRGLIQNTISRRNIHVAIWLTAILFSGAHLQFYGFFPRIMLGAMLGYTVYWSGAVLPAMVAHFVNNATVVSFAFFAKNSETLNRIGTGEQWILAVISTATVSFLLFLFWKNRATTTNDAAHAQ